MFNLNKINRRTRKNRQDNQSYQALENRKLLAAAISYNATTDQIQIWGSSAADTATVTQNSNGSVFVQTNDSRSSDRRTISSPVTSIQFVGGAGNDYFRNDTRIYTKAWGGAGNDTLYGGSAGDYLNGGDGNDYLDGRSGNDRLWGFNGSDRIYGSYGNDELVGGNGNDKLYGNSGNDKLWGQAGNDYLSGWSGNDKLYGSTGNDELRGGSGNDLLAGGANNDKLYGDGGTDWLYGEAGNDGLHGGIGSTDYLNGGSGADRFLTGTKTVRESYYSNWWNRLTGNRSYRNKTVLEDTIADKSSADATIKFENLGASRQRFTGFSGTTNFAAGRWTDAEIKTIDVALGNLHSRTGNTRLLKQSNGSEMTLQRAGGQTSNLSNQIGGWNGSGKIAYTNAGMQSSLEAQITTYHEFGHNWDSTSENRYVASFRRISQWDTNFRSGDTASSGSGDNWFYRDSISDFARSYGTLNPLEDYATTWETYFTRRYHSTTNGNNVVQTKLNNLDSLFSTLA